MDHATNTLVKIVLGIVMIVFVATYLIWSSEQRGADRYKRAQLEKSIEVSEKVSEFNKKNKERYEKEISAVEDNSILNLKPAEGQVCAPGCVVP